MKHYNVEKMKKNLVTRADALKGSHLSVLLLVISKGWIDVIDL